LGARHKPANRKALFLGAGGVALVALVAVLLPQANAEDARQPSSHDRDLRALSELRQDHILGTAWATDANGKMVITADETVTGDTWDNLESAVNALGGNAARLKRTDGKLSLFAEGGDAIFAEGARCSLGFNVTTADGTPGFLTAGHCGVAFDQWSDEQNGDSIATVDQALFPGDGDFALVKYDDETTNAPSVIDLGNGQLFEINQAGDAQVGQQVFRMGSTTGLFDGDVVALNATVNYPEGTVTGLIQTTVCAEPGDSGGPLFTDDGSAIGLTSGGSGDCDDGGVTFFQPVTTALEAVGATIE
jgi:streptogrisin D